MKEKNAISGNEKCAGMGELLSNRLISLNFYCYFFKEIEKRNAKATVRRPSEAEDTLARMPTPGVCKPCSSSSPAVRCPLRFCPQEVPAGDDGVGRRCWGFVPLRVWKLLAVAGHGREGTAGSSGPSRSRTSSCSTSPGPSGTPRWLQA